MISPIEESKQQLKSPYFYCARGFAKVMSLGEMTQLDISCSVRELSLRFTAPYISDWRGIQHGLCYRADELDVSINYKKNKDGASEYCLDARILTGANIREVGGVSPDTFCLLMNHQSRWNQIRRH